VEDPPLPEDFSEQDVPMPVRAELRSLPHELALTVMGHLVAAGELVDDDPQLALRHALAARRRAARFAVVREVTAETAYAAADFPTALSEFRALHRMTGQDDYLPVIADCERAVGKHDQALRTIALAKRSNLSADQQVELVLVEAGLRDELGRRAESARLLRDAISGNLGSRQGQARLRYAYGALLEAEHDIEGARQWFTSARAYDDDELLDTQERLAALTAGSAEPDAPRRRGETS
jgi:tetratricopeptide (TPR) repeat protein